jgi:alpha-D-xyloside xylohydrolase
MLGPALMACPVGYYKARNRSVYFPSQCGWYDLYTGEKVIGRAASHPVSRRLVVDAPYERIPVYVREGAIIPFGPAMEWSDEKAPELIDLYVYGGRDAHFTLYEDEGTNYNYEQGQYATIDISYHEATRTLTIGHRKGHFPGMLSKRRFNIVYVTKKAPKPLDVEHPDGQMVTYDGLEAIVKL